MNSLRQIFAEIFTAACRECRMILQDKKLRSLLLVAPLINATIICGVYAPSYVTEVPIAVVDQDASALSQRMGRWLDQHQKLKVTQAFSEVADAEVLFARGKIAGYVVFEAGFVQRLKRNEEARVLLFCDATNMVLANTMNAAVQGIVQTFSTGLAMQKAHRLGAFKDQAKALVAPLRAEIRPIGNPSFSYADFMLPGMLLTVLQQVILLAMALTWAEAATEPSFRSWSWLLGKNLPHLAIHFVWLMLFFALVLPLSHVSSEARWDSLMIFAALFVVVMVCWGTWVSLLIQERLGATQALMFLSVPSFILSGYTWPTASLPEPLQIVSQALPLTHCAVMFRKLYALGLGIEDFPKELAVLILFALFNAAMTVWVQSRRNAAIG